MNRRWFAAFPSHAHALVPGPRADGIYRRDQSAQTFERWTPRLRTSVPPLITSLLAATSYHSPLLPAQRPALVSRRNPSAHMWIYDCFVRMCSQAMALRVPDIYILSYRWVFGGVASYGGVMQRPSQCLRSASSMGRPGWRSGMESSTVTAQVSSSGVARRRRTGGNALYVWQLNMSCADDTCS